LTPLALRIWFSVFLILFLLVGGVFVAITTDSGSQRVWQIAQSVVNDSVSLGELDGPLSGPFEISNFRIVSPAMALHIEKTNVQWDLGELLHGKLLAEEVTLVNIQYTGVAADKVENSSFDFSSIALPIELDIRTLKAQSIEFRLTQDAEPVVIKDVSISMHLNNEALTLRPSSIRTSQFEINANSNIGLSGDNPTTGEITWRVEVQNAAPLSGKADFSGSMESLLINATAAGPYASSARITVVNVLTEPQYKFSMEAEEILLSAINNDLPSLSIQGKVAGENDIQDGSIALQANLDLAEVPDLGAASVVLNGRLRSSNFLINKLEITQPDTAFTVITSGAVDFIGQLEFDLASSWHYLQWPLREQPVFRSTNGRLSLKGPLSELALKIDGALDHPLVASNVLATAELDLSAARPVINIDANIPEFSYATADGVLLKNANAQLKVSGQFPVFESDLRIDVRNGFSEPGLHAVSTIDLSVATLPQIDVRSSWQNLAWPLNTREPQIKSQQGTLRLTGDPDNLVAEFDSVINQTGKIYGTATHTKAGSTLAAQWNDLSYSGTPQPVSSKRGTLSIAGIPDQYTISLDTTVASQGKQLDLQTSGLGDFSSLKLDKYIVHLLDGSIEGSADIVWKPELQLSITANANKINPGIWWQDWPGQIEGRLLSSILFENEVLSINNLDTDLSGTLRDYPVKLELSGNKSGNRINIEELNLQSADTSLQAKGEFDRKLDFQWDLSSTDLQTLHPRAKGSVSAQGLISGTMEQPFLTARLGGNDIGYDSNLIKEININAAIDSSDQKPSDIVARLSGNIGGIELTDTSISASGLLSGHQIKIDADTSLGRLSAAMDSQLVDLEEWLFDLKTMEFDTGQLGQWSLISPSRGKVNKNIAQLGVSCFSSKDSEVCLDASRRDQQLEASTRFQGLGLSTLLAPFLGELILEGEISGSGNFAWDGASDPLGVFEIKTSAGQILSMETLEDKEVAESILTFKPGSLDIDLTPGKISAILNLPLSGIDKIQGTASISGSAMDWSQRRIEAVLQTDIQDIGFIEDLVPEISQLSGILNGQMGISGSVDNPVFSGNLLLKEGAVELVGPEVLFENINIELAGNPLAGMNLAATTDAGGGKVDITGLVDLSQGTPDIDLKIVGEEAQIMNTSQAVVYVSPDLALTVNNNKITLNGEITIPKADIRIKQIPRSALIVSKDQIIVSDTKETDKMALVRQISAKVQTTLGDEVNFSGFGLNGRLSGNLISTESPGKPSQLEGEIKVLDGKYQAYGQSLDIETGRLLFAGTSITNPSIDLRATRQPTKDISVGITARGNLRQPELTLFSSPSMTERNKLSYLLLGRAADQTSSGEKSRLGQLALAFGLSRTDGASESISNKLGIDKIGFEAEPGTEAQQESFVIGKYLTPRLYLRYGIGLFEPINTVRLQYSISEHWKVVTESSGKASSGDIQYSFDRGN